jgi:hypothetical protein
MNAVSSQLLIPPKSCRLSGGVFNWPAKARLASPRTADALPLRQLQETLSSLGVAATLSGNAFGPADVRIFRSKEIANAEGYRLRVASQGITVLASQDAGAYYALATLRELINWHGASIPCCTIDDEPDFGRRAVYVDCSRGKVPTLQTLKDLVERLARWKINELQLYVENVFHFVRHPAIGRSFGRFNPGELLALQDHCKRHHVSLVGSLASFGHMDMILTLPEYRHMGIMPGQWYQPAGTTLCPTDESSITFMRELYEEFVPLFEAVDFNACCDETWEVGKGRTQQICDDLGVGRVYLDFLKRLHSCLESHCKRMNVWADIVLKYPELLADAPKDIVFLNWEYEVGPRTARTREFAEAGVKFMVCPGTNGWLSHGTRMDVSVANVATMAAEGRKWGAQGMLNTDWGDRGHRNSLGVSLHSYAHGAAHSWNGAAVDDESFTRKFCFHTFGAKSGELAELLSTLGRTHLRCPGLYQLLVRSLCGEDFYKKLKPPSPVIFNEQNDYFPADFTKPANEHVRGVVADLADADASRHAEPTGKFERIALREVTLAARMDVLAARRVLAAQAMASGRSPSAKEYASLAADMEKLEQELSEVWLMRNKPSKLADNLKLMQAAADESRALAENRK